MMEEWKEIKLGEVLKYQQPYNYIVESTQYNDKSGIPVLTAGKSFILGYTNETENVYRDFPVIIFDDFTTDCKFVDFAFKVKSSAMKFLKERKEGEVNLKYIFSVLQTQKIRGITSDHKRRWISEFSKHNILIPSLTEQTQIANILSTADEAIAQTEQLIAKYQRIKTGLMQDLLTKGIDEHGNIRNKATHTFVVKNGVEVPEEWEVVDIVYYTKNDKEAIKPGPFGSSIKKEFYTEVGYKVYGQEQVIANDASIGNYFIDKKRFEELKRFAVSEGDILLSCVGTIGNILIIPKGFKEGIINPRLLKITVDQKFTDVVFFAYYMKSEKINSQLLHSATGGTMPVLNKSIILNLKFAEIKKEEQLRIVEKFNSIENLIEDYLQNLQKLHSLKTGLMQDLLSGKVRVKDVKE